MHCTVRTLQARVNLSLALFRFRGEHCLSEPGKCGGAQRVQPGRPTERVPAGHDPPSVHIAVHYWTEISQPSPLPHTATHPIPHSVACSACQCAYQLTCKRHNQQEKKATILSVHLKLLSYYMYCRSSSYYYYGYITATVVTIIIVIVVVESPGSLNLSLTPCFLPGGARRGHGSRVVHNFLRFLLVNTFIALLICLPPGL